MKSSAVRVGAAVVCLGAIAGFAVWRFWRKPPEKTNGPSEGPPPSRKQIEEKAEAVKAFREGQDLYDEGKVIAARKTLSAAFFSGHLSEEQENKIIPVMTELAERTLLSGNFYDDDPYVFRWTIQKGDMLGALAKKFELHVPSMLLEKVNGIKPGGLIREGAGLTMVQGPFHAIVRKSKFKMDVYLHREPMPKIFIKRIRVGVGAESTPTPPGRWHVALRGKVKEATWTPPGGPLTKRIKFGAPGYPLGKKGYWIPLAGDDPENRKYSGIGIHGTSDPTSVGKGISLGCVRLLEEDIEWVYAMLYEKWSTVWVGP